MEYESGAGSHLDRMGLTKRLCDHLEPLFDSHGILFQEYGSSVILEGNASFQSRLRKLDVKKSNAVCMTKFAPDYLVYARNADTLFMIDAKVSITPIFFDRAIQTLQLASRNFELNRHRIGEIEREAWDNYTLRYPQKKVAIVIAAPYSPNLVLAEWASELTALYRFEEDVNKDAHGSGTPHVNIDLGSMRSLRQFVSDELDIEVDFDMYEDLEGDVKKWPLNKPNRVNWKQFNNVVFRLATQCPWIKGRMPKDHSDRRRIEERFKEAGLAIDYF